MCGNPAQNEYLIIKRTILLGLLPLQGLFVLHELRPLICTLFFTATLCAADCTTPSGDESHKLETRPNGAFRRPCYRTASRNHWRPEALWLTL
jgi:hypothetical protein